MPRKIDPTDIIYAEDIYGDDESNELATNYDDPMVVPSQSVLQRFERLESAKQAEEAHIREYIDEQKTMDLAFIDGKLCQKIFYYTILFNDETGESAQKNSEEKWVEVPTK